MKDNPYYSKVSNISTYYINNKNIDGNSINFLHYLDLVNYSVALVYQNINDIDDKIDYYLSKLDLVDYKNYYPDELSGGMKKRVAIARAIALNPKYLFCDEPNSGLDPQTSIVIDNLIKDITEEFNITTIVNTHDMNSVLEIGDKILFVHKGEKWWEGTIEDILKTDNKELNDFIFASKLAKNIKKTGLI